MGNLDGLYYAVLAIFWIAFISTGAWVVYGIYHLFRWLL